jgi:IS5 family transposase
MPMRKPFDRQRGLGQVAIDEVALDHRALREIVGLGAWDERTFTRSTIHENLGKLRTETIAEISRQIVAEGHRLVPQAPEAVRGDGFLTETNIHYPTDASLVIDGLRVMLRLVARLSKLTGVTGWRQHKHLLKRARKVLRKIGRAAKRRKDKEPALQAL